MDQIVQDILNLDNETKKLRDRYEEILKKEKFEGLANVQKLEEELLNSYEKEAQEAYINYIEEKTKLIPQITQQEFLKYTSSVDLNQRYEALKAKLLNDIWESILTIEE
jgi:phenylalanine-4-hydroxylase